MKIFSLIQARGGSKSVPGKNIKSLGGFPLIAYSIVASKLSKLIQRTIVSTDSEEIREVSKKYGVETPFLRPAELARDLSTDFDVINHALRWLKEHEGVVPDLLVHLRPTTPLRDPALIDEAINAFLKRSDATSLRSAHELSEPPQKMFMIDDRGFFTGFFPNDPRPEYYNLPRQVFSKAYHPNGYVDIVRGELVLNQGQVHGPKILSFITPVVVEIDRPVDFDYLEYEFSKSPNVLHQYLTKTFSY